MKLRFSGGPLDGEERNGIGEFHCRLAIPRPHSTRVALYEIVTMIDDSEGTPVEVLTYEFRGYEECNPAETGIR